MPADGIGDVLMPGVIPKFSLTPGSIRHGGPALGQHNGATWLGIEVS